MQDRNLSHPRRNASRTVSPLGWMASTLATSQPLPRCSSLCPTLDGMKVGWHRTISSPLGAAIART
jgi:hypothetical protein